MAYKSACRGMHTWTLVVCAFVDHCVCMYTYMSTWIIGVLWWRAAAAGVCKCTRHMCVCVYVRVRVHELRWVCITLYMRTSVYIICVCM
jgi:hypothetical protein